MRGRATGGAWGRRRRRKHRAQGGDPTAEIVLAGARAGRTLNISPMVVTWDVSKLSGWLNADADCRVERRACDAGRGAAREA